MGVTAAPGVSAVGTGGLEVALCNNAADYSKGSSIKPSVSGEGRLPERSAGWCGRARGAELSPERSPWLDVHASRINHVLAGSMATTLPGTGVTFVARSSCQRLERAGQRNGCR